MGWFRNWKCIRADHYRDVSFQDVGYISPTLRESLRQGAPSTKATYLCTKTGQVKTEIYYGAGYLTIEELNCAYKE